MLEKPSDRITLTWMGGAGQVMVTFKVSAVSEADKLGVLVLVERLLRCWHVDSAQEFLDSGEIGVASIREEIDCILGQEIRVPESALRHSGVVYWPRPKARA